MTERAAIYRRASFNAAHRLCNEHWTDEKNQEVFGKCNNHNYHGHNYTLILKLIGEVDPETGFVVNLTTLKKIINEEIIERFDHKNLNLDCPEFEDLNPSAENIAIVIYRILSNRPELSKYQIQIRLYETDNNFVEYPV